MVKGKAGSEECLKHYSNYLLINRGRESERRNKGCFQAQVLGKRWSHCQTVERSKLENKNSIWVYFIKFNYSQRSNAKIVVSFGYYAG